MNVSVHYSFQLLICTWASKLMKSFLNCPIKNAVVCFKNVGTAASYLLINSKILPEAFKELLKRCIICWSGGNKIASTTLLPKRNIIIHLRDNCNSYCLLQLGLELKWLISIQNESYYSCLRLQMTQHLHMNLAWSQAMAK